MRRFNVVTKKEYEARDGTKKAQWNQVGTLVYFPPSEGREGGFALELHWLPGTKFYVFDQKKREDQDSTAKHFGPTQIVDGKAVPIEGEDIQASDIPF